MNGGNLTCSKSCVARETSAIAGARGSPSLQMQWNGRSHVLHDRRKSNRRRRWTPISPGETVVYMFIPLLYNMY